MLLIPISLEDLDSMNVTNILNKHEILNNHTHTTHIKDKNILAEDKIMGDKVHGRKYDLMNHVNTESGSETFGLQQLQLILI